MAGKEEYGKFSFDQNMNIKIKLKEHWKTGIGKNEFLCEMCVNI